MEEEKFIFENLLAAYRAVVKQVRTNIATQFIVAILVASSFGMIDPGMIPNRFTFLGVELGLVELRLAAGCLLLVLWISCGFLVDSSVKMRIRLLDSVFLASLKDQVILYDHFFVDSYFTTFFPRKMEPQKRIPLQLKIMSTSPFFIIGGLMYGLNHALILMIIYYEVYRKSPALGVALFCFFLAFLFLTYLAFGRAEQNKEAQGFVIKYLIFMAFVVIVTAIVLLIFLQRA